jgi:hypothetical protein
VDNPGEKPCALRSGKALGLCPVFGRARTQCADDEIFMGVEYHPSWSLAILIAEQSSRLGHCKKKEKKMSAKKGMNAIRKRFELELPCYLTKLALPDGAHIQGVDIIYRQTMENKVEGFVEFCRIYHEYGVRMCFASVEFAEFLREVSPPYPNYSTTSGSDWHFRMTSARNLNGYKPFGNKRGTFCLPIHAQKIDKTLDLYIREAERFCLPLANNFYLLNRDLIRDVMKYPCFYAYPVLLIIFLAKKHGMRFAEIDDLQVFEKIDFYRASSFDRELAKKVLRT